MRKTILEQLSASEDHPLSALCIALSVGLADDEIVGRAAVALRGRADAEAQRDARNVAALLAAFNRSGRMVYDVAPQLSAALLACEANVRPSEVRLPFACFYLRFSGTGITFAGKHPLRGATVHRREADDRGMMLSLHIGSDEFEPAGLRGLMELPPEETLEEFVASMEGAMELGDRDDFDAATHALRLAVNALLYITCSNADLSVVPARPQHERARTERRERRTALPIVRVGYTYKLPSAQRASLQESGGTGSTLAKRVAVRGHYRNQACGPHFSEHRLLWIEPHWRGPESAPISGPRRYVVEPLSDATREGA